MINYAQLRTLDIANGEGIRVSLFVSGCTHNCKGCFNKEYQSFSYGKPMNFDLVSDIIDLIGQRQYKGLTLLGGEPFQNLELVKYLMPIREFIDNYNKSFTPDSAQRKNIWAYSGYTYEQILSHEGRRSLLALTDVLVDGLFIEKKKDLRLKFRGSSNQRVIDVKRSLASSNIITYYNDKLVDRKEFEPNYGSGYRNDFKDGVEYDNKIENVKYVKKVEFVQL